MKKNRDLYELKYPHYLEPRKRVWVLKPGGVVLYKGKRYRLKQVLKSRLAGSSPKLVLEEIDESTN